jgi:hypothetical protein
MTAKLKAMLILLGVVGSGVGAVQVYRLRPDVTRQQVADEGIMTGGVRTTIAVEGRRLLSDGGYQYGSGHVDGVWRATDRDLILDPPNAVEVFRPDRPRRDDAAGLVAARAMVTRTDDCACSSGANCTVLNPSTGLQVTAPTGVTLAEGTFLGIGCVRKVCGGVLTVENGAVTDPTWPAGCPP